MGVCYEIPSTEHSRQWIIEADSAAGAIKHYGLPPMGETDQVSMNRIVTEKRVERINHKLFRVTAYYEDPTADMGAGI